jgi:hypothetical protein
MVSEGRAGNAPQGPGRNYRLTPTRTKMAARPRGPCLSTASTALQTGHPSDTPTGWNAAGTHHVYCLMGVGASGKGHARDRIECGLRGVGENTRPEPQYMRQNGVDRTVALGAQRGTFPRIHLYVIYFIWVHIVSLSTVYCTVYFARLRWWYEGPHGGPVIWFHPD